MTFLLARLSVLCLILASLLIAVSASPLRKGSNSPGSTPELDRRRGQRTDIWILDKTVRKDTDQVGPSLLIGFQSFSVIGSGTDAHVKVTRVKNVAAMKNEPGAHKAGDVDLRLNKHADLVAELGGLKLASPTDWKKEIEDALKPYDPKITLNAAWFPKRSNIHDVLNPRNSHLLA
ncbi:hypothetical protein D9757_009484 [Collybiopsis confluens]|uniref:Uncharacterized protein n=1 Tax=Collybiopsis confluens TaxID=2823264 RepID=A0A8H5H4V0_9AGAR|nr:hypothetical protein D9757_009484 [Collybiopsis confluens]